MTPSPAVVIEMSASDASTPNAQVLVEACSDGLRGGGPCALEDSGATDSARAVAIVSWEGSGRGAAKIEVGVRRAAHADWLTRHVTFDPSDAEIERWRSVGLIIATLVGSEVAKAPVPPPETSLPAPAPPKPSPPPPPAPTPEAATSWSFEVGAAASRGAGDVFGAWGPTGRVGAAFRRTPVFVTGSLRYEIEPPGAAQVRLEWGWVSLGAGIGAPLGRTPLLLEARLEPTLGGIRATSLGSAPAQAGGLFGVREGVALTWWWAHWIGLSLSAEALETTRSTVVNVSSNTGTSTTVAAKAQWFGWSSGLGLRFRTD
jgi:hypothetical protein